MRCVCVFIQTCYLDSCIPVIQAQAKTFWEAGREEDEMKIKKKSDSTQASSGLFYSKAENSGFIFVPSEGLYPKNCLIVMSFLVFVCLFHFLWG